MVRLPGKGNTIFVGSACDMFGEWVPPKWQEFVFAKCRQDDNTYFFQTKNPLQYHRILTALPKKNVLGATIETNRIMGGISKAPPPSKRFEAMRVLGHRKRMISIEPIMDFDLNIMVNQMDRIKPNYVSIGADSKGHKLPEPPAEKIIQLISELKKITEVKIKTNLKRLIGTNHVTS